MTSTIVFGPSGAVASAAVKAAQQHGAKVSLAMRDTGKPLPRLNSEDFVKVQGDLTKPETIREAVTKTGAKHAFIYLMFGQPDHMKSSIAALKSAGIEYVVFLSSYSVKGNPEDILPSEFIAYAHAQVEISLREIFGPNGYTAVRPAYFASNSTFWTPMIAKGEVTLLYPDAKFDFISPEDIGTVCGNLLAGGLQAADGKNHISLCGHELISQADAVAIIGNVLGKDIKIKDVDEEAYLELNVKEFGRPEPLARSLIGLLRNAAGLKDADGRQSWVYEGQIYQEAKESLQKYGERQPQTFQQFVSDNKKDF